MFFHGISHSSSSPHGAEGIAGALPLPLPGVLYGADRVWRLRRSKCHLKPICEKKIPSSNSSILAIRVRLKRDILCISWVYRKLPHIRIQLLFNVRPYVWSNQLQKFRGHWLRLKALLFRILTIVLQKLNFVMFRLERTPVIALTHGAPGGGLVQKLTYACKDEANEMELWK